MELEFKLDVHQQWLMDHFPTADQAMDLIEGLSRTMRVPVRRFATWGEATQEVSGSLSRGRSKLVEALTHGHRGNSMEVLAVSSYNHRGTNYYPDSHVMIAPHYYDDGRGPTSDGRFAVGCVRRLEAGETPEDVVASWQSVIERCQPGAEPDGEPTVKRHPADLTRIPDDIDWDDFLAKRGAWEPY